MGRAETFPTGRPRRGEAELAAVRKALAAMPGRLSARAKCRVLAKRVADHLLAAAIDPMDGALAKVRAAIEGDPALVLALDPAADLHRDLVRERVTRFERRGCTQLPRPAWEAETREIAAVLESRFAERFRRACKNWAESDFSPSGKGQGRSTKGDRRHERF